MNIWLRRSFTLFWLVAPYVGRLFVRMMWAGLICFRFLWSGVDEQCIELGRHWTTRALQERNGLTAYEEELLSIFTTAAWLTVIIGWLLLAHLTVFLWGRFWIWVW